MTVSNSCVITSFDNQGNIRVRDNTTAIIRSAIKRKFYCGHCGAIFTTTKYDKTKKGHSAHCPCCDYRAWGK